MWKPLSDFYKLKRSPGGVRPKCKSCTDVSTMQYMKKNREAVNEQQKNWREANYDKHKEYVANYREKNREAIRETTKLYQREWKKDPMNHVIHNLRSRVVDCIKKDVKAAATKELLGCSIEEFKSHIESQFTEGMSWSNYGEWHIDHIKPVASYNLLDPDQQRECFNYNNMQPLWASDNWKKNSQEL